MDRLFPNLVPNWVNGEQAAARSQAVFEKLSPHDGAVLGNVARSDRVDIEAAIAAATSAQPAWAAVPAVERGKILHHICNRLESAADEIAAMVAIETGKSRKDALGEVGGAIALGRFFAGEGQRLYGRTTTSGVANRYAMTVRQPCGVAGLIIAANTPIANVAWKVFPALICGNGVVLKAAEDTPGTAWLFGKLAHQAGIAKGILNIIQGFGREAGAPLVEDTRVQVVSFTGSTAVGRWIAEVVGKRLGKVSLELGGKNPFVVCDDADLDNAVKWACLSAFSNAGQRCAAASRLIVCDAIYDEFVGRLVAAAAKLKVGPDDSDDFGPVINARQLNNMLGQIDAATQRGARLLAGGHRLTDQAHKHGFYLAPTVIEDVDHNSDLAKCELFGPVAAVYRARDFAAALAIANDSPYALTACIHTRSFDRALEFTYRVRSGVATVNGGTYGSEPHMPFGGPKQSGNGSREPGTEALDIYSDLKDIYYNVNPTGV